MESVDRLRNYVEQVCGCNGGRHDIQAIADEIEREHRKLKHDAVCKAHADGEKSGLKQARSASEDFRRGCRYTLEKMADTHIALPVDEDGTPTHVGDKTNVGDITGMYLTNKGWEVIIDYLRKYRPSALCHVKPDSWERIIADAYQGGCDDPDNEVMRKRLIDRCKALAGEE